MSLNINPQFPDLIGLSSLSWFCILGEQIRNYIKFKLSEVSEKANVKVGQRRKTKNKQDRKLRTKIKRTEIIVFEQLTAAIKQKETTQLIGGYSSKSMLGDITGQTTKHQSVRQQKSNRLVKLQSISACFSWVKELYSPRRASNDVISKLIVMYQSLLYSGNKIYYIEF